jgi:hypothetical protein
LLSSANLRALSRVRQQQAQLTEPNALDELVSIPLKDLAILMIQEMNCIL